jgi:hypothetical protein
MEYHSEVKNHVDNVDFIIITDKRSVVQKWHDATNVTELDILHEFVYVQQLSKSETNQNHAINNV